MQPSNQFNSSSRGSHDQPIKKDLIDVLIAYPKVLTGRLIAESLSHNPGFRVVGHVSSPEAVTAFTLHGKFEVVLIGLNLCGQADGLETLRRIRQECSDTRAIMLLESPDSHLVVECFRLGAKGVFSMANSGYDLLCKCILSVHQGQIWATSQELTWVLDALRTSNLASSKVIPIRTPKALELNKLSKREEEVVTLLADGLSNRDIARALNLSENTIKNYLFRIFEKVGVSNRTELLLQALQNAARIAPAGPEA